MCFLPGYGTAGSEPVDRTVHSIRDSAVFGFKVIYGFTVLCDTIPIFPDLIPLPHISQLCRTLRSAAAWRCVLGPEAPIYTELVLI